MTKADLRILTLQEGIFALALKVFNINVKALFWFKHMRVILLSSSLLTRMTCNLMS